MTETTSPWRSTRSEPLDDDTVERLDRWWRVANYLSVGQIYLLDNPCRASDFVAGLLVEP